MGYYSFRAHRDEIETHYTNKQWNQHFRYGFCHFRNLEDQTVFIMTRMRNIEVKDNGELIPHEVRTDPGENWGIVYSRMGVGKPHVYYGHDSGRGKNGTQRFERATGLDTGCYKGRYLTGVILPVTKEEFYKSKC